MIRIEKLRREGMPGETYRINFHDKELNVIIDESDIAIAPDINVLVLNKITEGIRVLLRGVESEAIRDLVRHKQLTGTFDTTGTVPNFISGPPVGRHFDRYIADDIGDERGAMVPPPTAENIASTESMRRRMEALHTAINNLGNKDKINDKAMKLLKSKIGRKLYKQLHNKGYFELKGKHGIYQFHLDNPHGVRFIQEVDAGGKKRPIIWDLCIQSSVPNMPKGDVILARYLECKTDEEKFRKTANWRSVTTHDEASSR